MSKLETLIQQKEALDQEIKTLKAEDEEAKDRELYRIGAEHRIHNESAPLSPDLYRDLFLWGWLKLPYVTARKMGAYLTIPVTKDRLLFETLATLSKTPLSKIMELVEEINELYFQHTEKERQAVLQSQQKDKERKAKRREFSPYFDIEL